MDGEFPSTTYMNTLEDADSSRQKRRGANKERSGPRWTWTILEEEGLINGLKSLTMTRWKCENGFRNSYLAQLEAHMKRAFSQCNIKVEPHITLKLHVWKEQYSTLVIMISKRGPGRDKSQNMVTVEDEKAWEEFVKICKVASNVASSIFLQSRCLWG
ncbi:UNVERIFIED_CONTAM: hypothetical protein Slati_1141000 [Sesamum latifolium]|uniref:Uncharacterized protein n=1 Tax=Sesamum latifolium TaxID=2727402 RepID=A0AAW2XCV8_9LAMI